MLKVRYENNSFTTTQCSSTPALNMQSLAIAFRPKRRHLQFSPKPMFLRKAPSLCSFPDVALFVDYDRDIAFLA
ncbi:MAG: hypothetical protein A2Z21_03570 [Candidatus Fraserbacteria bacterium RBG_16_55_9]|uniref:Uncharacterized protein n=1 Tax=Fraserbacteria sp. (strain RBG_16_55_9) TaxID=1817864 RepID=A0A1F5UZ71_FRAXR|nr:MAG: hypothetical protein A2Z21_03570 [Candidatus Fraserbacteria bacterium RBG_16_55_9]